MISLDRLKVAFDVLLELAEAYGMASEEAATLIESRRLVESEMRASGWEDE